MKSLLARIATFAACVVLLSACKSGEASLDAPETMEAQLIQSNIAARGGLDDLHDIETLQMNGEVFIPSMGAALPVRLRQMRPNYLRTEVDVEMMNAQIVSAYNGEMAWTLNPMNSRRPQKITGIEAVNMAEQAYFDGSLPMYLELGYDLSYEGEEDVRGNPAHHLVVTRPDSSVRHVFLDAESFLEVLYRGEGTNPLDGTMVLVETYLDDHREVEGVLMPFKMETVISGQTVMELTFTDVTVNEPVEVSIFEFPGN